MTSFQRPRPQPDEDSAAFWSGVEDGVLVVQRCDVCGNLAHPPVMFCEQCHSLEQAFSPARVSGRGRIVSWTVIHRALVSGFEDHVPFTYALVELEEQPKLYMAAELLDPDDGELEIGRPVETVFDTAQGWSLPCFRLL